jgi:dihydroorotate dehydrogenase electron transfer subunit
MKGERGIRVNKGSFHINPPGRYQATVIENLRLSSRYYLLVLSRPADFPDPRPGTFLHVGIPSQGRFFLRRPFSVFDCDRNSLTLLIVEKGEGTRILRGVGAEAVVDFLGPLGSSFPSPRMGRILAVTGGVGLAPLYYYPKYWTRHDGHKEGSAAYRLVYGGRTKEDLFLSHIDMSGEHVYLATEDGSHGFKGNAVDLADELLSQGSVDAVFSCGPTPMLKALSERTVQYGIPHWVSLENRMACAVGACRSCVIPVQSAEDAGGGREGGPLYKTVCHDGPVFHADEIVWETIPVP